MNLSVFQRNTMLALLGIFVLYSVYQFRANGEGLTLIYSSVVFVILILELLIWKCSKVLGKVFTALFFGYLAINVISLIAGLMGYSFSFVQVHIISLVNGIPFEDASKADNGFAILTIIGFGLLFLFIFFRRLSMTAYEEASESAAWDSAYVQSKRDKIVNCKQCNWEGNLGTFNDSNGCPRCRNQSYKEKGLFG